MIKRRFLHHPGTRIYHSFVILRAKSGTPLSTPIGAPIGVPCFLKWPFQQHRKVSTLQFLTFFKRSLQCYYPALSNFIQSNCVTRNKKHSILLRDKNKMFQLFYFFIWKKEKKWQQIFWKFFVFKIIWQRKCFILLIIYWYCVLTE